MVHQVDPIGGTSRMESTQNQQLNLKNLVPSTERTTSTPGPTAESNLHNTTAQRHAAPSTEQPIGQKQDPTGVKTPLPRNTIEANTEANAPEIPLGSASKEQLAKAYADLAGWTTVQKGKKAKQNNNSPGTKNKEKQKQ